MNMALYQREIRTRATHKSGSMIVELLTSDRESSGAQPRLALEKEGMN